MVEEGLYYSGEDVGDVDVEDGCLLLGLTPELSDLV